MACKIVSSTWTSGAADVEGSSDGSGGGDAVEGITTFGTTEGVAFWPARNADAKDAFARLAVVGSLEASGALSPLSEVAARTSARGSSCVMV